MQFTNCQAIGRIGPTLLQCRSSYINHPWTQDTVNNYLNMTTNGIQLWTVPITSKYTITAAGACSGTVSSTHGRGIIL